MKKRLTLFEHHVVVKLAVGILLILILMVCRSRWRQVPVSRAPFAMN